LIQIDTTNILFILGGAFDGIDEVIKRRLGEKVIGFASNEADKYDESNVSKLATIGTRPINSGIKPYACKSSGRICANKASSSYLSASLLAKPITFSPKRRLIMV
jgi:hypothetical protein